MSEKDYKVYNSRWLVLLTVAALNIAINTLVYSYSSVAIAAAVYYEREPSDIDLLTTMALISSLVSALAATWVVERVGLRWTVVAAGSLVMVGGAVRMLSTFPGINDNLDKQVQFDIALVAQFIIGLANPLAFCLPSKVAVDWFPEKEAPLASGLILISFVLGQTIAMGINPFIFAHPDYIEWMNIVFFIPTVFAFFFSVFLVRSDLPPTPPTNCADVELNTNMTYFQKIKALCTNKMYIVLILTFGGVQGFMNGLVSRVYQMGCAVGYDEDTMAIAITVLLSCGLAGAFLGTLIFQRTGLIEEQAKISFAMAALIAIPILYLMLVPDKEGLLITAFALAGLMTFGILPLGVELILENTFPIDPPTGLIFMFMYSMLTSIVIIAIGGAMEQDLTAAELQKEVCTEIGGGFIVLFEAKDHVNFIVLMMCYVATLAVAFIVLLRSKYRRRRANEEERKAI